MSQSQETVRVWVGLDLLQAQMLRQMLEDNGIACLADRDLGMIPAGEFGEIGLWVNKQDERQARTLLHELEDRMSADLDREIPEDE
ncbi:MAG: putative signal transducing protein [Terriglobia bacterium]